MEASHFDRLIRSFSTRSRRSALHVGSLGALGLLIGKSERTNAGKKKRKKKRGMKQDRGSSACPPCPDCPTAPPPPPANLCTGQNWCVDRTQTCGPAGGYGKCLVEVGGGNLCAEILFQTDTCADCEAPSCNGCRCVLAAGGGDRCNNGVHGKDFICVRPV